MRPSLLPQMIETLGHNLARQNDTAALFEIGRVFGRRTDGTVAESERVSLGLMGTAGRIGPDGHRPVEAEECFLWLRGIVDALCDAQRVSGARLVPSEHPALDETWRVGVEIDGRACGVLGIPCDAIRHRWRMLDPVAVGELDLAPLLAGRDEPRPLQPLPRFPAVRRDVALIADAGVRHEQVLAVIRAHAPAELTAVSLFDIFSGDAVGKGRRSLAYSLTYRSADKSLTDEDANAYHDAIKRALRRELNVEIRE
jgi:phenylalanyl-tRNA synthetase beta chain